MSEAAEQQASPRAGWYPDPDDQSTTQRWWNGFDWTDSTQAISASVNPYPGTRSAPSGDINFWTRLYNARLDAQAQTNAAATMALATGIIAAIAAVLPHGLAWLLSLFCAVAAIVWGIIGVRRAKAASRGLTRAALGIALGCAITLADVATMVVFWLVFTAGR